MTPLYCSAKSTALRKEIGSPVAASAATQAAQESTSAQVRAVTLTAQSTRVVLKQRGVGGILKALPGEMSEDGYCSGRGVFGGRSKQAPRAGAPWYPTGA